MVILNAMLIINLLCVAIFMYSFEVSDKEYVEKNELDDVDKAIMYFLVSVLGTFGLINALVKFGQPKTDKDTLFKNIKMLTSIIRARFGL